MSKKRLVYRDKETGRFVRKSTWNRSRGHGGTRYTRTSIVIKRKRLYKKVKRPQRPPVKRVPPAELPVREWIMSLSYKKSGRSFDVIVTARDETEAYNIGKEFLRDDAQGQRIVRAGFSGWQTDIARGPVTDEEPGEAEYRSGSRAGRKRR